MIGVMNNIKTMVLLSLTKTPTQSTYKSYIRGLKRQKCKTRNEFIHLDQKPDVVIFVSKERITRSTTLTTEKSFTTFSLRQQKTFKQRSSKKGKLPLRSKTTKNDDVRWIFSYFIFFVKS